MNIPEEPHTFNALKVILELFPSKEPKVLSVTTMAAVKEVLAAGKIICKDFAEVMQCLEVLKEMNVLEIIKNPGPEGSTYLVGNIYNGR